MSSKTKKKNTQSSGTKCPQEKRGQGMLNPREREAVELIEKMPEKKREAALKTVITQVSHFSGPLPHPDILMKYNEVAPGAADRIIAMAENQADHRQFLEKTVVTNGVRDSKRGQIFAFMLALVAFVCGFVLLLYDKQVAGFSVLIGSVGSLVVVFVYGKKSEKQELTEKNKEVE